MTDSSLIFTSGKSFCFLNKAFLELAKMMMSTSDRYFASLNHNRVLHKSLSIVKKLEVEKSSRNLDRVESFFDHTLYIERKRARDNSNV